MTTVAPPTPNGSTAPEARVSERLRRKYRRISRVYDLLDLPFERGRYQAIRPRIFDAVGASARILECAVGTGRNFAHHPVGAEVVGFDLSEAMLARASLRARRVARPPRLLQADALHLPLVDASFDAAVATFLFCVLPDEVQVAALREMARVVKPGGPLVLLEYTYSRNSWRRLNQRLFSPWVEWAYGARFDRRTREHIGAAGLTLRAEEHVYEDMIVLLTAASTPR